MFDMLEMHGVQLTALDLNLLVVLEALLETRSVKTAARRVALSPSATSHALARLRETFDDPLLVRAGRALVPTPRAEALRPALHEALERTRALLAPAQGFDPASLHRAFRLGSGDYAELLVFRDLSRRVAAAAPGVDLLAARAGADLVEALRAGELDVAVGVLADPPPDLGADTLLHDRFVSVLRGDHPAARRRLTLASYLALDHLLVAPRGVPSGPIDATLAAMGHRRRVARTVTSFLAAPWWVAGSDLCLTISSRIADVFRRPLGLVVRELPFAQAPFEVRLFWHRRHERDPAHAWLRDELRAAVAGAWPGQTGPAAPARPGRRRR